MAAMVVERAGERETAAMAVAATEGERVTAQEGKVAATVEEAMVVAMRAVVTVVEEMVVAGLVVGWEAAVTEGPLAEPKAAAVAPLVAAALQVAHRCSSAPGQPDRCCAHSLG